MVQAGESRGVFVFLNGEHYVKRNFAAGEVGSLDCDDVYDAFDRRYYICTPASLGGNRDDPGGVGWV